MATTNEDLEMIRALRMAGTTTEETPARGTTVVARTLEARGLVEDPSLSNSLRMRAEEMLAKATRRTLEEVTRDTPKEEIMTTQATLKVVQVLITRATGSRVATAA